MSALLRVLQRIIVLTVYDLASLLVLTLILGVSAGILILAFVANSRSNDR